MIKYTASLLLFLFLSGSAWAKVTITVVNGSKKPLDNVRVTAEGTMWGSVDLSPTEGLTSGGTFTTSSDELPWYMGAARTYYVHNHFNVSAATRCATNKSAKVTATITKADHTVKNSNGTEIDVYAVQWSGCASVSTGNSNQYCLSSYDGGCGVVD